MGFAAVGVLAVLPACGDSSGGTVSDSNSASGGGTTGGTDATMGATEPTSSGSMSGSTTGDEGGVSDSLSGTTGDEGGNSDSLSGTVSSGVESDSVSGSGGTTTGISGTSGSESGEVETSATSTTTGEPIDCAEFVNEAQCVAAGCMPIKGQLFFDDGADLCLEASSFLACVEQAGCAEVITTVCKGQVQYQLPNACIPDGYMTCEPPFDPDMMFDECQ